MYAREEILNNYKKKDFPKSLFDENTLNNKNILFYPDSKPPQSSKDKDKSKLSQSYVLPWRILQQKNYHPNNNPQNKVEFSRSGHFTPAVPKEPLIDIKTENFKHIYDKYSIPLDKKLIYLKYHNNISGPFNYEELQNMYKNKKYDSNYEFRTIDLFAFLEEDPFNFYPLKNINEDNWTEDIADTPYLEYTELFIKVKELLDGTKKRKLEINELNDEIIELKTNNKDKDKTINELTNQIDLLNKELTQQKELLNQIEKEREEEKEREKEKEREREKEKEKEKEKLKEEDEKEESKKEIEIIEIKKKIISKNNDDDEEEKEIVEEEKMEIIQPKVLDMGGEWEIPKKKKKKIEKKEEEPKVIIGLSTKKSGGIKNNADSLIKIPGSNKGKKNQISGEELVDLLRPKKKEVPKEEGELSTTEFKEVKGKGKKKIKNNLRELILV